MSGLARSGLSAVLVKFLGQDYANVVAHVANLSPDQLLSYKYLERIHECLQAPRALIEFTYERDLSSRRELLHGLDYCRVSG